MDMLRLLPNREQGMMPMDNQVFDPFNILLLVIAVVVAWRLYSVLGTRTGNEKRLDLPFPGRQQKRKPAAAKASAPEEPEQTAPESDMRYGLPEERKPAWEGVAEEGSELARTLERMRDIDPAFDARHFLKGARVAYEMIVTAFAAGDRKTLKSLLAPEVLRQFEKVIDERKAKGQVLELEFVGLDEARLLRAELNGTRARLTVKFVSKVITALKDGAGNVIEGNPEKLATVKDIWTFERDLTSSDPNWRLVSTEAPA